MKKIVLLLIILIWNPSAYAGDRIMTLSDVYQPNVGNIYEQAERTRNLLLQNQMMERQLQQMNQQTNQQGQAIYNDGYNTGYKQGFDQAMGFNQLSLEQLNNLKNGISEKYSKESDTYKQLMPMIDWRIKQLEESKKICSQKEVTP